MLYLVTLSVAGVLAIALLIGVVFIVSRGIRDRYSMEVTIARPASLRTNDGSPIRNGGERVGRVNPLHEA